METQSKQKILLENFMTSSELAEVKVIYRNRHKSKTAVKSSRDAYEIFYALYDKDTIEFQEQFYLLLLNQANYVLGWIKISQGGTTSTVVDARIIFTLALKTNSKSILLCHNHPSGNIMPSEVDKKLTKTISMAGQMIEIKLLDHIIIAGDEHYYSFADEGEL